MRVQRPDAALRRVRLDVLRGMALRRVAGAISTCATCDACFALAQFRLHGLVLLRGVRLGRCALSPRSDPLPRRTRRPSLIALARLAVSQDRSFYYLSSGNIAWNALSVLNGLIASLSEGFLAIKAGSVRPFFDLFLAFSARQLHSLTAWRLQSAHYEPTVSSTVLGVAELRDPPRARRERHSHCRWLPGTFSPSLSLLRDSVQDVEAQGMSLTSEPLAQYNLAGADDVPSLALDYNTASALWLWSSAVADLSNSLAFARALGSRIHGFNETTDTLLRRLIFLAVRTASYTTILSIAGAIANSIWGDDDTLGFIAIGVRSALPPRACAVGA